MENRPEKTEGLTDDFLKAVRERIESIALEKAYPFFIVDGWEGFRKKNSHLKENEQIVNFFDYHACVIFPLSARAAAGSDEALTIVRKIIENTQYYMTEIVDSGFLVRLFGRPGFDLPLRRLMSQTVLAYRNVSELLSEDEKRLWNRLMYSSAKMLLRYVHEFKDGGKTPHNGVLGLGVNHYAVVCEDLWLLGDHFDKKKWKDAVWDFVDRLMAFAPEDGYFEEHTNLEHEGGPSLRYTPLTAGAMFHVHRLEGREDQDRFARCDEFQRNMVDQGMNLMCFADERSNEKFLRPFGLALHSLTPEGRHYLREILAEDGPLFRDQLDLQKLGRLYFEIDGMQTGEGAALSPFTDGDYRITLPLAVKRKDGWTVGVSALKCLNREIEKNNDYALDRQNLFFLSHKTAGIILRGFKSKDDPGWSTLIKGEDAYPDRNGEVNFIDGRLESKVFYPGFEVDVAWEFEDQKIRLTLASEEPGLTLQLPLELVYGQTVQAGDGAPVVLGDDDLVIEKVRTVKAGRWTVDSDAGGKLVWPSKLFSPYSQGNISKSEEHRAMFRATWNKTITLVFSPLP